MDQVIDRSLMTDKTGMLRKEAYQLRVPRWVMLSEEQAMLHGAKRILARVEGALENRETFRHMNCYI